MDTPRLLILRLWTAPSAFRAVVRDVGPEHIAHFDDPDALCRYLLGRAPPPACEAGPDQPPDSQRRPDAATKATRVPR